MAFTTNTFTTTIQTGKLSELDRDSFVFDFLIIEINKDYLFAVTLVYFFKKLFFL